MAPVHIAGSRSDVCQPTPYSIEFPLEAAVAGTIIKWVEFVVEVNRILFRIFFRIKKEAATSLVF